ncbi:hypothetical protein, partial [Roseivivax halodurans]|uniref:hypothetical protein n=1 Tax=Roseivivax halodurans TaxID=93683 RepID=UPI001B7F98EF
HLFVTPSVNVGGLGHGIARAECLRQFGHVILLPSSRIPPRRAICGDHTQSGKQINKLPKILLFSVKSFLAEEPRE